MQYSVTLQAGVPLRASYAGRVFVLTDTGAASTVAVAFRLAAGWTEPVSTARRGFKLRGEFEAVELTASVGCVVTLIASRDDVDVDASAGAVQLVSNDRGSIGSPLYVVGVSLADAAATGATNNAPVACSSAAAVVAGSNANRRSLKLCNLGPDPVAIGAAGITWANRTLILEAGDVVDLAPADGANLAWSGITDAAKSASVTRQEVSV